MGKRGPKGVDADLIYAWACDWFRLFKGLRDGAPATVLSTPEFTPTSDGSSTWDWVFTERRGIPAEPETLNKLLNVRTRKEVLFACEQSQWWLHPLKGGGPGSPYPPLPALAQVFLSAKKHPRYPRSHRPSSLEKRLWFLAVALAAKTWKVSVGTAINSLQARNLCRPDVPQWWNDFIERTGGVMELEHPAGNYYTDGHAFWSIRAAYDKHAK
jgi:hypothetical protein